MPSLRLPAFVHLPLYAAAGVGLALAVWIERSFGDTDLDQILWHLQYLEPAATQLGSMFVPDFVVEVLLFPLAFALLAAMLHGMLRQPPRPWQRGVLRAVPWLAVLGALFALLVQFSVFSYAAAQFQPDHFAENYVEPRKVRLTDGKPRNLVLIYVESLEQSYGNPAIFGRDLLADLRGLGGFSFASYRGADGANWTIAAMVATQCGVPLRTYAETDVRRDGKSRAFLPRATCLGDLLQARGYDNVFMGGVPLSFAGKGSFLRDHGYPERWGREQWEAAGVPAQEFNEWGLYDHSLFARAKARLEQLHAAGRPFNLTLLTLDTHNPQGFYSPYCRARGARDFSGIVACAGRQLADFAGFMRDQGYLKDTTLVVLGDHLAMPNPVNLQLLQAGSERRIFNLVLADPLPRPARAEVQPFDLYPTLVEMLGIQVEGHRLGLGYSAVAETTMPPLEELTDENSLAALRGSSTYDALWESWPASVRDLNVAD
ncbi:sulfatase-like hydrolase/transferase [Ramlibacter sp. XY19]|uniref:sulfatase-like hydrolase/transferase n=1 Tax=Ramlibacter paludis TaxID=2908000 RepID=UPI0023DA563F|nr:sulfatase-like hydrolase/transferase [Ramlibacter paludis]MCG2594770.1 sulfatase-like hydrolase/transferase [Ramlibacter paludis]